ncbi:MAG: response regulator transcription factor [Balneola sp.]|nr:response regulator transcription factor [Balneola sp.]MBO6650926.1 response regulator transcription factor [Balneola sp.]MBO6711868.1 response regulator transcription factor [Balneola sp.]MBO6800063.1 response regulator transcription factor [Balneola sp.]MBO6871556.1 response regulator transcription factor [Balneola sp.]
MKAENNNTDRERKKNIEIIIVDDHPLVREGIKKVLMKGDLNIDVSGESDNYGDFIELLDQGIPDLVILDIGIPGKSGLVILKELRNRYKNLPVLILSMHPEEKFAIKAIRAGANGYLTKESVSTKLVEAVDIIVNKKGRYINQKVAEQLAIEVDEERRELPHESLSKREYQIMCMIASAKKIKEIADELSLNVRTVHTYRARLMDKLNLESNVAIARYALANELIDEL